jgi:hypothetical protein
MLFLLILGMSASSSAAQEADSLVTNQEVISGEFRNFEAVLQRMADLMQATDPDRAALVRRVLSRSKKDLVPTQFQALIDRLRKAEWKEASDEQAQLLEDLNALLELMLSEDRGKWLREERQRVEAALRTARQLERRQQEIQGKTERSTPDDSADLAEEEGKLARETSNLAEQLQKRAPGEAQKSDDASEPQPAGDPKEAPDPSAQPAPASPPGGPGDQPPPVQPQPGGESKGTPEGQPGDSETTPAAKSIQKAADAMRQAQEKLKELEKEPATEEQEEAIRELKKAIAELEEVLRQLREEERIERLATLEARCRKMLEMQQAVEEATARLDEVPSEKRTRVEEQQAATLSRREQEIANEADQALLILREDGTAIAFYEAFVQIREDISSIVSLLAKVETGALVQGIEADVVASLEEMVAALKKEISESKKGKSKPGGGGPPQNPPLVEKLAELKLVRSMQARVYQRTDSLAKLPESEKTLEYDAIFSDLANRQARIHSITRDLAKEMPNE